MLFFGLASRELNQAIELYATQAEAEQALIEILADEPTWRHLLYITPIQLAGPHAPSLN